MKPLVWKNEAGQTRYQPMLENGERKWYEYTYDFSKKAVWAETSGGLNPCLYRSRSRAERVAKRKSRKNNNIRRYRMFPVGEAK